MTQTQTTQTRTTETLSKETFGQFSRYCLKHIRLTLEGIQAPWNVKEIWQVTDAESQDEITGLPAIIRMKGTREEAVAGLR